MGHSHCYLLVMICNLLGILYRAFKNIWDRGPKLDVKALVNDFGISKVEK